MNAAPHRSDLKPRPPPGIGPGLLISSLIHAGLIVALAFGVNWRASEPEGVTAELWAAVPQVAAPRAVEPEVKPPPPAPTPPPPPRPQPKPEPVPPRAVPDALIAIEKAKREKEKQKAEEEKEKEREKEKAKKAQDEKKRAAEEKVKLSKLEAERLKKEEAKKDEQLAAQREANLKRIMGEAGATGNSAGKAAQTAGPSAAYAGRIKARVKPNILFTDSIDSNPVAEVEVQAGPDGTIISSKLIKSSGVKAWDDAVLRAIEKTEVLPRDTDGTVPSPMVIAFRPRDF